MAAMKLEHGTPVRTTSMKVQCADPTQDARRWGVAGTVEWVEGDVVAVEHNDDRSCVGYDFAELEIDEEATRARAATDFWWKQKELVGVTPLAPAPDIFCGAKCGLLEAPIRHHVRHKKMVMGVPVLSDEPLSMQRELAIGGHIDEARIRGFRVSHVSVIGDGLPGYHFCT